MGSRLTIQVPPDYRFARDVCSYGYFLLAPNLWNPEDRTLTRPLDLEGGVADIRLSQPADTPGAPVRAVAHRVLTRAEQRAARQQIVRMLRLDDEGVADFHRVDPRWKRSGRARLFRSPTFFEDLVKTVTSCNVQWPSTMTMNQRFCEVINPAFPRPEQLARRRPASLRARCRVGYRDVRIVSLAKLFVSGEVSPAWFEDPSNDDDTVFKALLALPGIGPYAAGNVMQLLGRYSRLALDTESIRHGKSVLGMKGTDAQLFKKLDKHYAPFGDHKFRSYWFEIWDYYETKRGHAWTWDPATTGKTFTAALLEPTPSAKKKTKKKTKAASRTGRHASGNSTSSRKRSVSQT